MKKKIDFHTFCLHQLKGRYVTYDHIGDLIGSLPNAFMVDTVGRSVLGEPITSITYGYGSKRILMWSQMHGNESTTTKAVLDLLNYLKEDNAGATQIARSCTIKIIPILNPDGARAYTRVNHNNVDLNRDAQELSQPESRTLLSVYELFHPDFCFNLHDQRTIFNVGNTNKPATVSFLAPAFDLDRNNSDSRIRSMQLIAAMNEHLQSHVPGQVGRYDDGFNPNCVGDAFQMKKTPTVLFEAGHYYEDYEREKTREFIFYALVTGIDTICSDSLDNFTVHQYAAIPENGKQFVDFILEHTSGSGGNNSKEQVLNFQYKETLIGNKVVFKPEIYEPENKKVQIFGHKLLKTSDTETIAWLKEHNLIKLIE